MAERVWFLDTEVTFLVSSREEAHGIAILEHVARAGDSPPLHAHRIEDETFHVISGALQVVIGGEVSQAGPGQTVRVPKGVAHTYLVRSKDGARFLTITGGEDFERLVRMLARTPEGQGLPPPSGPPSPEQIAGLVRACSDCGIDIVGPPLSAD